MKTIDDIIKNLSLEERKLHEELIQECQERETNTIQHGIKLRKDIDKLGDVLQQLLSDIDKLNNLSEQLKKHNKGVNDNLSTINLSTIPDDWFFHA